MADSQRAGFTAGDSTAQPPIRYMVKCERCGELLDVGGDRIHICEERPDDQ